MSSEKRLFLIDGSALFYRSYFAFIRNPLINSKGENTSARFGFALSLMKILTEEKPDYIAVVFDTKEPTFRHKKYKEYKATREKMPLEMIEQYPKIVDLVKAFNIPVLEKIGYEADDVIATLAKRAEKQEIATFMVTSDKDFMQLLSPLIKMYIIRPGKDVEIFGQAELMNKHGMTPEQVIDYLALMGDSSDNVPGVPGIGEKTAKNLLKQFGSLEEIYQKIDEVDKPALNKKLCKGKGNAYLSKELVTIDLAVPLEVEFRQMQNEQPDLEELSSLFEVFEFRSLLNRLVEFGEKKNEIVQTIDTVEKKYELVRTKKQLEILIERLIKIKSFTFDTETTGLEIFDSEIIGIAISLKPFEAFYIPLLDEKSELDSEEILGRMKALFEDLSIKKYGQNIKFDGLMLYRHGIHLKGIAFDTMIADYLINPGTRHHNLDSLAEKFLNYKMVSIEELIGKKGKKQKTMLEVPIENVYPYACEDADVTMRLTKILQKKF
jgi:DNA polymerase-1